MQGGRPLVRIRRDRHHQREGRRRHGEDRGPEPQATAQRDEAVAKKEQGVAPDHEEHEGQITNGGNPVAGEGIHLAGDAGQAKRRERERQVAAAPFSMAQPVHDREHAKRKEAEADDGLHDLEPRAHQHNFTLTHSEKATSDEVR
jgi:hypothetical protein